MPNVVAGMMRIMDRPDEEQWHCDSSCEHIDTSTEGSLKALGTDYIDAMLHRPDALVEPGEGPHALDHMKESIMSVTQQTDMAGSLAEFDDHDEVADNTLRPMSHPDGV